jgi:hypothetical protein
MLLVLWLVFDVLAFWDPELLLVAPPEIYPPFSSSWVDISSVFNPAELTFNLFFIAM